MSESGKNKVVCMQTAVCVCVCMKTPQRSLMDNYVHGGPITTKLKNGS